MNPIKLPDDLVGWHVKVPIKCNRQCSNWRVGWWVKVLEQRGQFIRVGGNARAGSPWWTERAAIMESAAPAALGTARLLNGFKPGDAVRLIRTIVQGPTGDQPGTFFARKGEKVIVRSVADNGSYPITVSHESRKDGAVFGVTPEEIEPW